MLDRIEFLMGEAFSALRRNGLMTFAAISTASVALFLLAGLGYAYFRVSQSATAMTGKFEVRAFCKADITKEQLETTQRAIEKTPGVKSVTLVSRDEAWKQMKEEDPEWTEGLDNPLPDGFNVRLTDVKDADSVVSQIRAMGGIDNVQYMKVVQQLMDDVMRIVRWLGGALGSLLLITAGILIYNAIRLTVIARRREIRIMQLVGASYFTVRTPFVIEGMIQGMIGGFIANILLWIAQLGLQQFVNHNLLSGQRLPDYPFLVLMLLLMAAGACYGFFCSSWAVKEPLRHGTGFQR